MHRAWAPGRPARSGRAPRVRRRHLVVRARGRRHALDSNGRDGGGGAVYEKQEHARAEAPGDLHDTSHQEALMTTTPEVAGHLAPDRVVDNRVYSDPEVFAREVAQVFGGSWLFVCHESEVANVGDFIATNLCGSPVLITRDHDERLRAYFNVCRHRGCRVVMEDSGHASAFRCPYHFWVYSLEG